MEEVAAKILSTYGLAGLCIAALSFVVVRLWVDARKVNDIRLADIQVLTKALENNTQAAKENASAIVQRNLVTEGLAKAIEHQATMLELFMQKTDMRDEALKDKMMETKMVIDSFSEALRTCTGIMRDVRDIVNNGRRAT